jgi:hypothetical protein
MARAQGRLGRRVGPAPIHRSRAAWGEGAPSRKRHEVGRLTIDRHEAISPRPEARNGLEQRARVGVGGRCENLSDWPEFHDAARVHDRHLVAHAGHDAQVVGDEDHGQAVAILQFFQQVEILSLNR